ncbi:MAG: glycosyltransferase family 2 protein [Planctomycetota bacterium]
MSPRPRVSFVVPVRNGRGWLGDCLDSALAQTMGDLEVVVVDDGSTDGSRVVADDRARGDRRCRVLAGPGGPEGGALVAALNLGVEAARAPLVARLDADDVAAPERLALQCERLDRDPTLAVVDGRMRLTGVGGAEPGEGMRRYADWVNGVVTPDDFDRALLQESPVVHPAATFRRDVVRAAGGYRDGAFPEDYDLWLRLHRAGHRLAKVEACCVTMRDHGGRLTRSDARYDRAGFRRVAQAWIEARLLPERTRLGLWGGPSGARPWLRWLRERDRTPRAFFDIATRRLGGHKGDNVPVVSPDRLPELDLDLLLVALAGRGAVDLVRADLARLRPDWREGRDWWAVVC